MCGIVGYVGRDRRAMDVLVDGLRRLEYRGYDSAGVAIFENGTICVRRALGKLVNLEEILRDKPIPGHVGIGHTRWATHGKPSERNAHPHRAGSVVIVHNGIVENYRDLRQEIENAGRPVESETDTELIAHLVDMQLEAGQDMLSAVRVACGRLEGSYAFGALSSSDPRHIVVAKNGGSPIILGLGEKEAYLASDIPAILPYTRQMFFLEDGEFAVLSEEGIQICDGDGHPVEREPRPIQWDPVSAEKGGYDRFMQKEIFEQPRAIIDTIGARVYESEAEVDLDGIDLGVARRRRRSAASTSSPAAPPTTPAWWASTSTSRSRAFPRRSISPASSAIAIRSSTRTASWCRSPSPGRRRTRWRRCARPGRTAHGWSRSATCARRRSRARATTCSTRTPGRRSAWPRPRPSPRRSWRTICWP